MDFELLINNIGLHHILLRTLSYLDFYSLVTCECLSKDWKSFIRKNMILWKQQLRLLSQALMKNHFDIRKEENGTVECLIRKKETLFLSKFPTWTNIIKKMESKSVKEIKIFLKHIFAYCEIDWTLKKDALTATENFSPWCPLFYAIFVGDLEFVDVVLEDFFSMIEGYADQFNTACEEGLILWTKLFLMHAKSTSKSLDFRLRLNMSPLHEACMHNRSEIVKLILEASVIDVNAKDNFGWTPLHCAIDECFPDIVKILCHDPNIDVNAKTTDDETPLHMACFRNNIEGVKVLLQSVGHRLNVNVVGGGGKTPIHLACSNQAKEIVELLCKFSNEPPNVKSNNGDTPLHLALKHDLPKLSIIKILLNYLSEEDINIKNDNGYTPLHLVSLNHDVSFVKLLLDHGAKLNVNALNNLGFTALHLACKSGSIEKVKLLFEQDNIDANIGDEQGMTPLHDVCQGYRGKIDEELVAIFLEHDKVDVNAQTLYGMTPLHLASVREQPKIVSMLCAHSQVNVNASSLAGRTALHQVCSQNSRQIAQILCSHESVDLRARDMNGETPLSIAIKYGYSYLAEVLKKHISKKGSTNAPMRKRNASS